MNYMYQNYPIYPAFTVGESPGLFGQDTITPAIITGVVISPWVSLFAHTITNVPAITTRISLGLILSLSILATLRLWKYGISFDDLLTNKNNWMPIATSAIISTIISTLSSFVPTTMLKGIAKRKYSSVYATRKAKRIPNLPKATKRKK